jgi:DNA-binding transcriptional regulator YiaG
MLVKAWEQGMRKPSRMARRLMDEIRANPSRWRAKIHHQPIAG